MTEYKISGNNLKYAKIFDKIASAVTKAAGSPVVSVSTFVLIIIWALTGPLFGFSDT